MSKKLVSIMLILAIVLSITATYVTITNFSEAPMTGNANAGNVGLVVKPSSGANLGIVVLPQEKEDEK